MAMSTRVELSELLTQIPTEVVEAIQKQGDLADYRYHALVWVFLERTIPYSTYHLSDRLVLGELGEKPGPEIEYLELARLYYPGHRIRHMRALGVEKALKDHDNSLFALEYSRVFFEDNPILSDVTRDSLHTRFNERYINSRPEALYTLELVADILKREALLWKIIQDPASNA